MSTRTRSPIAFALLFLAFVVWRGGLAIAACGRELASIRDGSLRNALTWSEEERIRSTLAARDVRVGLPRGMQYELYRAVMDHVEPEGLIHALAEPGRGKNVLAPLHFLVFPRIVIRLEELPRVDAPLGAHVYALDFGGAHEAELAATCDVVARGASWSLWRPHGNPAWERSRSSD